uniref:Uncharacterized protein MANES_08G045600 n=1 Tax=Rhizophora mucronata TaxID=61149 RepID=A0A2P2ISK4_RHIMU
MGEGFYLENLVPIGEARAGLGGHQENLKCCEHCGDAIEVWAKAMGFTGVLDSRLQVGVFEILLSQGF